MLHHTSHPPPPPSPLVFNEVPSGSRLQHITQLGDGTRHGIEDAIQPKEPPMYIGAGLPPVPSKLVKRIQDGRYIDMAELLPTNLSSSQSTDDEQSNKTKNKYQEVTNIVRWLQCFGIYLAVISRSAPHRTVDLLGYQNLIIQGYLNYQDGRWVVYDRQFRQKASATSVPEWSAIDTTLWNLAFSGHVTGHHDDKQQEAVYPRKDPPQAYRTPWMSSPMS